MATEEEERPSWRPLSVRLQGAEAEEKYDALHEGVPTWLRASILGWVQDQLEG